MYIDDGSWTQNGPTTWSWCWGTIDLPDGSDDSQSYTSYGHSACPCCGSVCLWFHGSADDPHVYGECSDCGTKFEFPDYDCYNLFLDAKRQKAQEGIIEL